MEAFAGVALMAAVASCARGGYPGDLLFQKVTLNDIAATARVYVFGLNSIPIEFHFVSSTYPVGCLSAYRDVRYELRDMNNRIIPVDQQALERPHDEGQMLNHVLTRPSPYPCAANAPMGVWNTRAWFDALYPNLPPGKYTLRIAFAPRGTVEQAVFSAVAITIRPSPSPSPSPT
jgi:hypothetical protein